MKRGLVSFFLICFFSIQSFAGVILQGFYWDAPSDYNNTWWDRLAKESQSLSRVGFSAVWLPPVWKGATGGYSMGYDPFDDYDIGSKDQKGTIPTKWGNREQLQRAAAMMKANGLALYLDMILTHRKGDGGDKKFLYKNAYGQIEKGRFQKSFTDFGNIDTIWGRAFNQDSSYVRENLKIAGEWLVKALDSQGMRLDFGKGLSPYFIKDYLSYGKLNQQLAILEYWGDLGEIQNFINQTGGRISAFDFPLWEKLKEMANGRGFFDMRKLQGVGLIAQDPSRAVTFVENHDTDREHKSFNKLLGYAFILTSEGYPSVFWKDYFDYGMKDDLNNLIWIHEKLAAGKTEYRWADDDLLVFERMDSPGLIVALNDNQTASRTEWVKTQFGANVQLHDYSGKQKDIWTNGDGYAQITVGPNSYSAYSRAGQGGGIQTQKHMTTQEFAGADDLDIKPAENKDYQTIAKIFVDSNTDMITSLNYDSSNWTQSSQFQLRILDPSGSEIVQKSAAGKAGEIEVRTKSRGKGHYELQVRTQNAPTDKTSFWWRQTYQAPQTF